MSAVAGIQLVCEDALSADHCFVDLGFLDTERSVIVGISG